MQRSRYHYHPWHDLEALSNLGLYEIFTHLPYTGSKSNNATINSFLATKHRWENLYNEYFYSPSGSTKSPRKQLLRAAFRPEELVPLGWPEEVVPPLVKISNFSEILGHCYQHLQTLPQKYDPESPDVHRWPRKYFDSAIYEAFQERLNEASEDLPSKFNFASTFDLIQESAAFTGKEHEIRLMKLSRVLQNWPAQRLSTQQQTVPFIGHDWKMDIDPTQDAALATQDAVSMSLGDMGCQDESGVDKGTNEDLPRILEFNHPFGWDLELSDWCDVPPFQRDQVNIEGLQEIPTASA